MAQWCFSCFIKSQTGDFCWIYRTPNREAKASASLLHELGPHLGEALANPWYPWPVGPCRRCPASRQTHVEAMFNYSRINMSNIVKFLVCLTVRYFLTFSNCGKLFSSDSHPKILRFFDPGRWRWSCLLSLQTERWEFHRSVFHTKESRNGVRGCRGDECLMCLG